MGYELYLLPVPPGADVEETAEALLVRLARGHERSRATQTSRSRADELALRLNALEPDLVRVAGTASAESGEVELRARSGLVVTVSDRFARFLLPFAHMGDAAQEEFRRLFRLVAAVADATGWRPYDPQEAEVPALDDAACEAACEIYLSVMDQLRPAGTARDTSAG